MKRLAATLLTLAMCLPAGRSDAQAAGPVTEEDQRQYDQLFRDRLDGVAQTRGTDDDRSLALEMLQLSKEIGDDPGVQALIYIDVVALASSHGDIETALDAADKLEAIWPGHEAADPETLLVAAGRAYRDAARSDRPRIAEPYLELLLNAAERAETDNDLPRAIGLCRQANTVARAVDSEQRDYIEDTLARLSAASDLYNRVQSLTAAVQNNPRLSSAARELVNLLVVGRDDPAAAVEFAELTGDEDLAEVVAMCAAGLAEASAPEALRVADWYLALADDADGEHAERMLRYAQRWYARFQQVYPREDALAKRVESMSRVAKGRVDRLAEARRAAMRGRWIDLIDTAFDPQLHTLGEGLTLTRGRIDTKQTDFILPVSPNGDYELRVRLTINAGTPGMTLHLPVGFRAATFSYATVDNQLSKIHGLNAVDSERDNMNRVGRRVELVYQIAKRGNDEVALAMQVDGKSSLRWEGPLNEVNADRSFAPPEDTGTALRFTCKGDITFHSIELRERAD